MQYSARKQEEKERRSWIFLNLLTPLAWLYRLTNPFLWFRPMPQMTDIQPSAALKEISEEIAVETVSRPIQEEQLMTVIISLFRFVLEREGVVSDRVVEIVKDFINSHSVTSTGEEERGKLLERFFAPVPDGFDFKRTIYFILSRADKVQLKQLLEALYCGSFAENETPPERKRIDDVAVICKMTASDIRLLTAAGKRKWQKVSSSGF